ncbi:MAG: hypothetical protein LKJ88_07050 [Bacilli bacterium]|jgi:hypothetical protein|nr:hypothetical protein [Bacilli bacterium]
MSKKNLILASFLLTALVSLTGCQGNTSSANSLVSSNQSSAVSLANSLNGSSSNNVSNSVSSQASTTSSVSSSLTTGITVDEIYTSGVDKKVEFNGVVTAITHQGFLIDDGNNVIFCLKENTSLPAKGRIKKENNTLSSISIGDYLNIKGTTQNGDGTSTSVVIAEGFTFTKLPQETKPSLKPAVSISYEELFKLANESNSGDMGLKGRNTAPASLTYKVDDVIVRYYSEYMNGSFYLPGYDQKEFSGNFETEEKANYTNEDLYSLSFYVISSDYGTLNTIISDYEKSVTPFAAKTLKEVRNEQAGKLVSFKGVVLGSYFSNYLLDDGEERVLVSDFFKEVHGTYAVGDYLEVAAAVQKDGSLQAIRMDYVNFELKRPTIDQTSLALNDKAKLNEYFSVYQSDSTKKLPSVKVTLSSVNVTRWETNSIYINVKYEDVTYSVIVYNRQEADIQDGANISGYFIGGNASAANFIYCSADFTKFSSIVTTDLKGFSELEIGTKAALKGVVVVNCSPYLIITDGTNKLVVFDDYGSHTSQVKAGEYYRFLGTLGKGSAQKTDLNVFVLSSLTKLSENIPTVEDVDLSQSTSIEKFTNLASLNPNQAPLVKFDECLCYDKSYLMMQKNEWSPVGFFYPDVEKTDPLEGVFTDSYASYQAYGYFVGYSNVESTYEAIFLTVQVNQVKTSLENGYDGHFASLNAGPLSIQTFGVYELPLAFAPLPVSFHQWKNYLNQTFHYFSKVEETYVELTGFDYLVPVANDVSQWNGKVMPNGRNVDCYYQISWIYGEKTYTSNYGKLTISCYE